MWEEAIEIIEKIAVSMTPGINAEIVRRMEECGMTPHDFLMADMNTLKQTLDFTDNNGIQKYYRDEALAKARKEMEWIRCHPNIHVLFLLDKEYPWNLREIYDAPVVLYQCGECDLNAGHALSIVGTRKCTAYGDSFTRKLVEDLAVYFDDLLVVSGLAFGIDAVSHIAALENEVRTVAVVAHGLDMVYPAAHRDLAARIVKNGGAILSEYPMGSRIFRNSFLGRNRIIAGLSPLTVIVESEVKGGAMNTAAHANRYDRQVMALPGRISDKMSSGCNSLIRRHMASVVEGAPDVMQLMNWNPEGMRIDFSSHNLFPELDGNKKIIYDCLRETGEGMTPDAIHYKTHLPIAQIMATLGEMEFDSIVSRAPGNRYFPV